MSQGFMKPGDEPYLRTVKQQTRAEILYQYLVLACTQEEVAHNVFKNYAKGANQSVSCVTRSFGFSGRKNCGKYSYVPRAVIESFVQMYLPENTEEGLPEGTFEAFLEKYYPQYWRQGYGSQVNHRPISRPQPQTINRPAPRQQGTSAYGRGQYNMDSNASPDDLPPILIYAGGILGLFILFFVGKFLFGIIGGMGTLFKGISISKLVIVLAGILIAKPILKANTSDFNLLGRIFILVMIWISIFTALKTL